VAFTLPEKYKGGFALGIDPSPHALETDQARLKREVAGLKSEGTQAYRLWQVNFHSPSEHLLGGKQMPLEMQMMHQRVTGGGPQTAVVVVFFADAANTYNDYLSFFANNLPETPWAEALIQPPAIPLANLLGGSAFMHYEGSLTVPPCMGDVQYYVRQSPIPAANGQLMKFVNVLAKTAAPKGNYRSLQPFQSKVILLGSVDLVNDPEKIVKPKNSPNMDTEEVDLDDLDAEKQKVQQKIHCPKDVYDSYYHNVEIITVGDPEYLVLAKERYLHAKREVQAAEKSYTDAARNHKFAQSQYDTAPGIVEKMHLKWTVDNAIQVEEATKQRTDSLHGSLTEPFQDLLAAIDRTCAERFENNGTSTKAAAADNAPYEYPHPWVTLPVGVSASPFSDVSDAGTDEGVSLAGEKIAPNLHQLDVPPSAITQEAGKRGRNPEIPATDKVLEITLPIDSHSIFNKGEFKKELVDALARTAHVSPDALSIKDIQDHFVPGLHSTSSSLSMSQMGSRPKREFLRAFSTQ
jgi:carbonic anhydrase